MVRITNLDVNRKVMLEDKIGFDFRCGNCAQQLKYATFKKFIYESEDGTRTHSELRCTACLDVPNYFVGILFENDDDKEEIGRLLGY